MKLKKMSKSKTWKFASIDMKESAQHQVYPATSPIVMWHCNLDIEKNVALESLQETFPHIVKDEIMQVLQITDFHVDAVDSPMETDSIKTTGKKLDVTLKCVFLSYKSAVKIEGSQKLTIIDRN